MMEIQFTWIFLVLITGPTFLSLGKPSPDNDSSSQPISSQAFQGDNAGLSYIQKSSLEREDPFSSFTEDDLSFILQPRKNIFDDSDFSFDSHSARVSEDLHNQIVQSLQGDDAATDSTKTHAADRGTRGSVGDVPVAPHDVQIRVKSVNEPQPVPTDHDTLDEYPLIDYSSVESRHPQTNMNHDAATVHGDQHNVQNSVSDVAVDNRMQSVNPAHAEDVEDVNHDASTVYADQHNVQNSVSAVDQPNVQNSVSADDQPNVQNSVSLDDQHNVQNSVSADDQPNVQNSVSAADQPYIQNSVSADDQPNVQNSVSADDQPNVQNSVSSADQPYVQNSVGDVDVDNGMQSERPAHVEDYRNTGTNSDDYLNKESNPYTLNTQDKDWGYLPTHPNPYDTHNTGDQNYQDNPYQQHADVSHTQTENRYQQQPTDVRTPTANTYPSDNHQQIHDIGDQNYQNNPYQQQPADVSHTLPGNTYQTQQDGYHQTHNTGDQNYQENPYKQEQDGNVLPSDVSHTQAGNTYQTQPNDHQYYQENPYQQQVGQALPADLPHTPTGITYPSDGHQQIQDTGDHKYQANPYQQHPTDVVSTQTETTYQPDYNDQTHNTGDHYYKQDNPYQQDRVQTPNTGNQNYQNHYQQQPTDVGTSTGNTYPSDDQTHNTGGHYYQQDTPYQQQPTDVGKSTGNTYPSDGQTHNTVDHYYHDNPYQDPAGRPLPTDHHQEPHQYPSKPIVRQCQTEFFFDFLNNWKERHGRIWMGHTGHVHAVNGKALFYGAPQSYLSIPFFSGNDLRPRYRLSFILETGAASSGPATVVSNAMFQPSTFGIYVVDSNIIVEVVPRQSITASYVSSVLALPLNTNGPNRVTVDHDDKTQDLLFQVNDKSAHAVARVPMISYEPLYIGAGANSKQPLAPLHGTISELSFDKCPRRYSHR